MNVLAIDFDERIQGICVTATCTYDWYISATRGAEKNLNIQRAIIKDSKAYRTLRADLRKGCVLPPIVLAMNEVKFPPGLLANQEGGKEPTITNNQGLANVLAEVSADDIYIVDGLQRTNALRQISEDLLLSDEDRQAFLARTLRIEVWLNLAFGAIAYRMLLLNAGQKPMSIKHQIEILSMKLKKELQEIPQIEILMTLDGEKRTKGGQFNLSKLAQAFQAWLQGSPNIDIRNTVMEHLLAESAIETLGTSLSGDHAGDDFKALVEWLVKLDMCIWHEYPQFLANETVLLGIAAAVGTAQRHLPLRERMRRGLERLYQSVRAESAQVLAVSRFNELRQGEDVRKVNVGQFTRDMVYRAFQEFFVSDGTKTMEECWAFGAAQS